MNTLSDLLTEIARALEEQDQAIIDDAERTVMQWMQTPEERDAQLRLIYAAHDAINKMEE